jgi:hypothetical protein
LLLGWLLAGLLEFNIDLRVTEIGVVEASLLESYLSTASAASEGFWNSTKAKSFLWRSLRLTAIERMDP